MNLLKKILLVSFLIFPFFASALSPNASGIASSVQGNVVQRAKQIKETLQEKKQEIQSIMEQSLEQRREQIEEHKSEILEQNTERREETLEKMEELKNQAEENRLRISEEMQEKMGQLVRERAEKLAQNTNMINLRFSESYFKMIDRIEALVDKLEERTKRMEDLLGIDLTDVHQKLLEARVEIEAAREAVSAQAEEVYEVSSDSMKDLGNAFRETMARMQNNHREVRNSFIVSIRETIRSAQLILREAIAREIEIKRQGIQE